jgi:1,4-alpha-glucan branching enzyme
MKQARRATRADKNTNGSTAELKPGEFHLEAPFAQSVKLAAGFTEWEKNPLELTKSENGDWVLVLPLPPGSHPYRYIVDGQWWDDPKAAQRATNPFGTQNSIKIVT